MAFEAGEPFIEQLAMPFGDRAGLSLQALPQEFDQTQPFLRWKLEGRLL